MLHEVVNSKTQQKYKLLCQLHVDNIVLLTMLQQILSKKTFIIK